MKRKCSRETCSIGHLQIKMPASDLWLWSHYSPVPMGSLHWPCSQRPIRTGLWTPLRLVKHTIKAITNVVCSHPHIHLAKVTAAKSGVRYRDWKIPGTNRHLILQASVSTFSFGPKTVRENTETSLFPKISQIPFRSELQCDSRPTNDNFNRDPHHAIWIPEP